MTAANSSTTPTRAHASAGRAAHSGGGVGGAAAPANQQPVPHHYVSYGQFTFVMLTVCALSFSVRENRESSGGTIASRATERPFCDAVSHRGRGEECALDDTEHPLWGAVSHRDHGKKRVWDFCFGCKTDDSRRYPRGDGANRTVIQVMDLIFALELQECHENGTDLLGSYDGG
jgi:hypothetical protein